MLFHTTTFLAFFLLFLVCYLPWRRTKWGVRIIVLFSSVFYGSWDWRFLPLLWVTILVDYWVGLSIERSNDRRKRKRYLLISIICNLSILIFFKYWNFLIMTVAVHWPAAARMSPGEILLPLGISFYVFQSMSYIIDLYRGKHDPIQDIWEFAAFVTFFPHLVAGPIQRIQQLVPQIRRPDDITYTRIASGIFLFSAGLFRKCMGDVLSGFHDPIFRNLGAALPQQVLLAIFTFGMQIYLDFNGYSEMAIGIARVIGIDLMQNFAAPYWSSSSKEFWRRWHISLSQWLRDYLYISLGGSRHGHGRQMGNLMVTMGLCGLWHGAGWNFVLWGLLHGSYLAIHHQVSRWFDPWVERTRLRTAFVTLASIPITYVAVNYAWVYFRLATFSEAMIANRKIWTWIHQPVLPVAPRGIAIILVIVLAMDLWTRFRSEMFAVTAPFSRGRVLAYAVVGALFCVAGIILNSGQPTQQFIYFQF